MFDSWFLVKVGKLLQEIHTQVQLAGSPGVVTPGGDFPDHNPPI